MHRVDWLGGRIVVERGTMRDYRALAHLHYVPGDPAFVAGVWRAVYLDDRCRNPKPTIVRFQLNDARPIGRLVGVAVLVYPPAASLPRERTLRLAGPRYGEKLKFVNRHIRTIARVIVHPQFRSLGIASMLVRRVCAQCPTRYVEAIAMMGSVHPLFERAGMTQVQAIDDKEAAYFIFDRQFANPNDQTRSPNK